MDRVGQVDPTNAAQAVGDHAALSGELSVVPQVLKIRAATGEEGIRLCDAVGTRFENSTIDAWATRPCSRSMRTRNRSPGAARETKSVRPPPKPSQTRPGRCAR